MPLGPAIIVFDFTPFDETFMTRTARRAANAPGIEGLERRTLLSVTGLGLEAPLVDPATSLFVKFNDGGLTRRDAALVRAVNGRVVRSYPDGPSLVAIQAGTNRDSALRRLRASTAVSYVEANGVIHASAFAPNDPQFSRQWGLNSPNDVDIDAPEAWQVTTGAPVIVAVIDTGLDLNNPEFAGRIWVNPGEIPGNRRDDDGDGYIDDVNGWNFLNNSADLNDYNGHGTHVTGILAAGGNNGVGGAGVDWGARIMPLKFMNPRGNGAVDDAVRAIYYAVNHGARVINASWGGNDYSQALVDAINYANRNNVVFVTAAGNESANNDVVASYPANVLLPNVLSVASVTQAGTLDAFSNYGARTVALAAPGDKIFSTVPGGYAVYSGTSMAAPFVSGVAALLVGIHPDWTAAQIVQRIMTTVKPLPALAGLTVSGGMVDAANALGAPAASTSATPGGSALPTYLDSDDEIHSIILSSNEYILVHGGTSAGFVTGLYQDVLGRPPEPAGLTSWVGRLQAGMSRFEVARTFLATPEAQRAKVARWFQNDLNRPAPLGVLVNDPTVVQWAGLLSLGVRDSDLRALVLGSDEFLAARGGTVNGFVEGLYNNALGRGSDPGGLASWTGQVQAGANRVDVARSFLTSTEGVRTKIARWFAADLRRPGTIGQIKNGSDLIEFSSQFIS